MVTGIEIIDLLAGALTLAFIGKLLFSASGYEPSLSDNRGGSREKLSLLNQQIGPKVRFA
ncbi:MAG: hypothetical protein EBZ48_03810 [Proteobacteria bacterium]|nr:hypothetical protein [Pseudomonadota bacterium]